jgi:hypothetical protein
MVEVCDRGIVELGYEVSDRSRYGTPSFKRVPVVVFSKTLNNQSSCEYEIDEYPTTSQTSISRISRLADR